MNELITVDISDMRISESPAIFVTYALGSCVGVCLYDPAVRVGGLGHIMLPHFPDGDPGERVNRYADSCLPAMVAEMERRGCRRTGIVAKIAGGAKMFEVANDSGFGNIGARNIAAVKEELEKLQVRITAEDTGLNFGRTVYFYTENGAMIVKSFAQGVKSY
ncbi:MAG TPA: chemotaxis protein CheD [Ruminococcaceae bacterium]|jgi:chemotaxis protein CheD|nr:chemotaxis protein CheD [Oscillospiraceae bacterium]HBG54923.1 chemotaxis protein CheD [Oscillospiraceae bacterium]HBT91365.1 chemotaxis protein CheD [Oscillospiraceae bacterium]